MRLLKLEVSFETILDADQILPDICLRGIVTRPSDGQHLSRANYIDFMHSKNTYFQRIMCYTSPGCSGIEPNVHGVGTLGEQVGLILQLRWKQLFHSQLPPGIRTTDAEDFLDMSQRRRCHQGLIRLDIVEDWDGHTPRSLPRDAPISSGLCHRRDAVLPHGRNPFHTFNRSQSIFTKG